MVSLKAFLCLIIVAVASAYPTRYNAPAQYASRPVQYAAGPAQYAPGPVYEEPYEERNYKVYYSVKDDPSYNYQTRNEEKNGNTVTGQYTVLEPTGELRVVNYIADDYGFRADVQNQAGGYGSSASGATYGKGNRSKGY